MNALIRSILFCIVVVLTVLLCLNSPQIEIGNAAGVVMQFPSELPGYIGKEGKPDPVELKLLPDDTQFAKMIYYTDPPTHGYRDRIAGSIVLSGEERTSIHRPEVCLQGQGWKLVDSRVIPIEMDSGKVLKVMDLAISKKVTTSQGKEFLVRAHYVYWFVGSDVSTPSNMERIVLTLSDNIFRNVNHRWAYISMMAVVNDAHDENVVQMPRRTEEEMVGIIKDLIKKSAVIVQPDLAKN